jgi:hypothetical protein
LVIFDDLDKPGFFILFTLNLDNLAVEYAEQKLYQGDVVYRQSIEWI